MKGRFSSTKGIYGSPKLIHSAVCSEGRVARVKDAVPEHHQCRHYESGRKIRLGCVCSKVEGRSVP